MDSFTHFYWLMKVGTMVCAIGALPSVELTIQVILELNSTIVEDAFSNCEVATPHLHAVLMGLITPHCRQLKVLTSHYLIQERKGNVCTD